MVLVYGLINTIASRGNNNFRHFEENLKPIDVEKLLDEVLDNKCQGRKFQKCKG